MPSYQNKTGTHELAGCSALNPAQTNARYDPVLLSILGCANGVILKSNNGCMIMAATEPKQASKLICLLV